MSKNLLIVIASVVLSGCEQPPLMAVGQLESDRVEVVAESSEPILTIAVTEGDSLSQGTIILRQDPARLDIRIAEARANIERIQAILEEQLNGPRQETVNTTRATMQEVVVERDFREKELQRLNDLRARNLTSIESVDTARKLLESAEARIQLVNAQLAELEAGTRLEQIAQTRATLTQAQQQLKGIEFDRQRLFPGAPIPAIVDSLPFEVGERPRVGDVVAVLLTGTQPYARVYIPEPMRLAVAIGSQLQVTIDGRDQAVTGTVRRIAAEASFTPYFALTERDRSRLSFMAELSLPELPQRLPEGVPVQVIFE
jgi:HlyD family secretion protein